MYMASNSYVIRQTAQRHAHSLSRIEKITLFFNTERTLTAVRRSQESSVEENSLFRRSTLVETPQGDM